MAGPYGNMLLNAYRFIGADCKNTFMVDDPVTQQKIPAMKYFKPAGQSFFIAQAYLPADLTFKGLAIRPSGGGYRPVIQSQAVDWEALEKHLPGETQRQRAGIASDKQKLLQGRNFQTPDGQTRTNIQYLAASGSIDATLAAQCTDALFDYNCFHPDPTLSDNFASPTAITMTQEMELEMQQRLQQLLGVEQQFLMQCTGYRVISSGILRMNTQQLDRFLRNFQ